MPAQTLIRASHFALATQAVHDGLMQTAKLADGHYRSGDDFSLP